MFIYLVQIMWLNIVKICGQVFVSLNSYDQAKQIRDSKEPVELFLRIKNENGILSPLRSHGNQVLEVSYL